MQDQEYGSGDYDKQGYGRNSGTFPPGAKINEAAAVGARGWPKAPRMDFGQRPTGSCDSIGG